MSSASQQYGASECPPMSAHVGLDLFNVERVVQHLFVFCKHLHCPGRESVSGRFSSTAIVQRGRGCSTTGRGVCCRKRTISGGNFPSLFAAANFPVVPAAIYGFRFSSPYRRAISATTRSCGRL